MLSKEMNIDYSVTSTIFEDKMFYGPDRVLRELKHYKVGDNIFHDCNAEGGMYEVPSAFVLKGCGKNVYMSNNFLYCHACLGTYAIFILMILFDTVVNIIRNMTYILRWISVPCYV